MGKTFHIDDNGTPVRTSRRNVPGCFLEAYKELCWHHGWYARIIGQLNWMVDEEATTCGTNGQNLIIAPALLLEYKRRERVFILAHEAMHVVLKHPNRFTRKDPELFNVACDILVNTLLFTRSSLASYAPADVLRSPYGMRYLSELDNNDICNMTAEEIYERLVEHQEINKQAAANNVARIEQLINELVKRSDGYKPDSHDDAMEALQEYKDGLPEPDPDTLQPDFWPEEMPPLFDSRLFSDGSVTHRTELDELCQRVAASRKREDLPYPTPSADRISVVFEENDDGTIQRAYNSEGKLLPGFEGLPAKQLKPDQLSSHHMPSRQNLMKEREDYEISMESFNTAPPWGRLKPSPELMPNSRPLDHSVPRVTVHVPEYGDGYVQIKDYLKPIEAPGLEWADVLHEILIETSHNDYSFMRPNKRNSSNVGLPSLYNPNEPAHFLVAFDASYSITKTMAEKFAALLADVRDSVNGEVSVQYFTDKLLLDEPEYFGPNEPIEFTPTDSGGTNFCPVLEFFSQEPEYKALVVLTDFCAPHFDEMLDDRPVLWIGPRSCESYLRTFPITQGEVYFLEDF